MAITRRTLLTGAAAMAASRAAALDLPFSGPVKIISGFAAGGSQDLLARLVGDSLSAALGRNVYVENRTGAGSRLSAESLKSAPPDGSTLLVANIVTITLIPLQYPDVRYDPLVDFEPVLRTTDYQAVLATGKATGTKTFAEAMAWAKANPAKASYGVPAVGSLPHLYGTELARLAGIDMKAVTYRGGAPIAADIAAGHLPLGFSAPADFAELHRAGTLTILAGSGTKRHRALPDVPTFGELGIVGLEANGWNGFFLPKGTPPAIIQRYAQIMTETLRDPTIVSRLEDLGFIVELMQAESFRASLVAEKATWARIVKDANLKL